MLIDSGWRGRPDLTLLCGGETLTRDLAERLLECGRSVWNLYGPTETTVWSTVDRVTTGFGPVSIGRPIDNTRVFVVDERQRLALCPVRRFFGKRGSSNKEAADSAFFRHRAE